MKLFTKQAFIFIFLFGILLDINAQSTLPNLDGESGDIREQSATCWSFAGITYTKTSNLLINGRYTLQSAIPTSLDPQSCYYKSPWVRLDNKSVKMKIKFDVANSATIRRIIFQYIPFSATGVNKEGTPIRVDSLNYNVSAQNPLSTNTYNADFNLPNAIINNNQPYKVMVSFVGIGGTARFLMDEIKISGVYAANPTDNCYPRQFSTNTSDDDADQARNDDEDYPEDYVRAYNSYYPSSSTYGTLMFEDLWPAAGDYDFNDLVMSYRIHKVTNTNNKIIEIKATFIVKAIGATFQNGFGIQLDGIVPTRITGVTGAKTTNATWLSKAANGLENNQQFANVIVYDNVNNYMRNPGSIGINTSIGASYVTPDTVVVTISLNPNLQGSATSEISVNPYLIINQDRSKEIHLVNFVPTSKASRTLFGTTDDKSNVATGVYYKSKSNLPWALDIPAEVPYMREKIDFLQGYLKFADWAQSEGANFTQWYLNKSGYRNNSFLY
ncbi:MAG: hypothetical protein RLY16_1578 [Bacteroidota bacterium]|jgi:LruC domain-containing protein